MCGVCTVLLTWSLYDCEKSFLIHKSSPLNMNIKYDQPIYFDSLMIPFNTLQQAEKSLIAQEI